MIINISQFVYYEELECSVAEGCVDGIRFAIVVNHNQETIEIRTPKGTDPKALEEALGDYADLVLDTVAEYFGWEEL